MARNRTLRGAARLYMVLRTRIGSKYDPNSAQQSALLFQYFKINQVQRWTKVLKKAHMVRVDKSGCIYFSKISNFDTPILNEKGIEIQTRHVSIPDQVLKSSAEWSNFLCCVDQADYAVSMKTSKRTKKRAMCFAVDNNPSGVVIYKGHVIPSKNLSAHSSIVQGVACSSYAKSAGVHKSTASRRRKKGARAGYYDLARWYYVPEVELTAETRFQLMGLELGNWDPNCIVMVDGRYLYEAPTQLIIQADFFCMR